MAELKITWIGTGSAFNPLLGHTSFIAESSNGRAPERRLMVDCGSTVPLKLIELGIIDTITDIAVTHPHADHIGGLEGFGLFHYYVLNRHGNQRPRLHIATQSLADLIWEHALKAGMGTVPGRDGHNVESKFEDYFDVNVGMNISIPGLPPVEFFATPHVEGMENYGIRFANGVYYSGDTVSLPPAEPAVIFQDCQIPTMNPGDVHIGYEQLAQGLSEEVKKKTYLVHIGARYQQMNPEADGFAGFVLPGQTFTFPF